MSLTQSRTKKSPERGSGRERRYGYGLSCVVTAHTSRRTGCQDADSFRECGAVCHITPDQCDKAVQEKFLTFRIGKSVFLTTHHCMVFSAKLFSESL